MHEQKPILQLIDITKTFPGVKALDRVHLSVYPGEVHALCGENGAGKSTLMKIVSGAQTYTSGKMLFEEKEVMLNSTKEAERLGIAMIYQEFNLIPNISIAENIFIGRYPHKKNGMIDWKQMYGDAQVILEKIGLKVDAKKNINHLSVGEMQMVEIAKCLSIDSKVIIMDEPTAALTEEEIEYLFRAVDTLKRHGIAVIYISHRMKEIFQITDRITIFRDGRYIESFRTEQTNQDEIVRLMVGRDLKQLYPVKDYQTEDAVLFEAREITGQQFNHVSFQLHRGEILGIAGLMGSGNVALSKVICGLKGRYGGQCFLEGRKLKIHNPAMAIRSGVFLVSDDRKQEGLVIKRNVKENISLSSLDEVKRFGLLSNKKDLAKSQRQIEMLRIKVSSPRQNVENLSGGNQQKVVFGKMLETDPKLIFLNEPTRGIDVGARAEIYEIMNALVKKGIGIILISSDLPELIGLSDRILVMRENKIVAELQKDEFSQEKVLACAAGVEGV